MRVVQLDNQIEFIDQKILTSIIQDYRDFLGEDIAFHIEHFWLPGTFDAKEEEIDFFLTEDNFPLDYNTNLH